MAPRALGAGGADGGIRPSLTGVHAVAPDRVGREPPSGFSFPAPFFLVTSSHPPLLILRGMTDICTSTPAPFPWSARATDRLHSPLHLCLWPHHSPRLRSPPGPSRHPRVPLSTPRTTPDSSSSSCLDRKSLGPAQTISASIPSPNLSGQCPLSKTASEPSIPAHTCHGQLQPHGSRLITGSLPVPALLCLALLRRLLW